MKSLLFIFVAFFLFVDRSAFAQNDAKCSNLSGKYFGTCKHSNGRTSKGRVVIKQDGCKSVKIGNRLDFNRIWNHLRYENGVEQLLVNETFPSGNHYQGRSTTTIGSDSKIQSNFILTEQNQLESNEIIEIESIQTEYFLNGDHLWVNRTFKERILPNDKMITKTAECDLIRKK